MERKDESDIFREKKVNRKRKIKINLKNKEINKY